jgi:hypothetical protein
MLQSTGSFDGENVEHPESPAATINSPEAAEIQSLLRAFRCMILLRLNRNPRAASPETAVHETNGEPLSLVEDLRKQPYGRFRSVAAPS